MNPLHVLVDGLKDSWENSITLKRNDFLVTKNTINTINTNLYFVKTGSLRVFIEDEEEQHTLRFGYKNSLITALDCFLTNKPTSFYIQAMKKCELNVIPKWIHKVVFNY